MNTDDDGKRTKDLLLSKAEFARKIGLSAGRISQLIAEGLPVRRGRVPLSEATSWIRANVASAAPGLRESSAASDTEGGAAIADDEPADLVEARRRKLVADERLTRIQIAEREGRLIDRSDVHKALSSFARLQSGKWQNFATRYGQEMAAEIGCDPKMLMAVLDRYIRAQLEEIANTKPTLPVGASACSSDNVQAGI